MVKSHKMWTLSNDHILWYLTVIFVFLLSPLRYSACSSERPHLCVHSHSCHVDQVYRFAGSTAWYPQSLLRCLLVTGFAGTTVWYPQSLLLCLLITGWPLRPSGSTRALLCIPTWFTGFLLRIYSRIYICLPSQIKRFIQVEIGIIWTWQWANLN